MTEFEKIGALLAIICKYFNISTTEVLGKKKDKAICKPRQALMFYLKNLLKLQWSEIGRYLGRDHSTVIHGHKQWSIDIKEGRYLDLNNKIKEAIADFKPAPGTEAEFKQLERKIAAYEYLMNQLLSNPAISSVHADIKGVLVDERRKPVTTPL